MRRVARLLVRVIANVRPQHMNLAQLKKNIDQRVQLRPIARRFDENGRELEQIDDDWIVCEVSDDGVKISNVRTAHFTILGRDHIHHFTSNPDRSVSGVKCGFLTLNVQVLLRGSTLSIEPTAPGVPAAEQSEQVRRRRILSRLRQLYILSHDGISSEMIAGIAPLPKAWTEQKLKEMGESWRLDQYF
jgi:hypothetical protein